MKPARLVRRLLAPVVVPGSVVVDPFCGSGPVVDAALDLGCSFVAGDASARAYEVTRERATRLGAKFALVER